MPTSPRSITTSAARMRSYRRSSAAASPAQRAPPRRAGPPGGRGGGAPLKPSRIVEAFFGTALELAADTEHGGRTFMRLLARTYTEPNAFVRQFLAEEYAEVMDRFLSALFPRPARGAAGRDPVALPFHDRRDGLCDRRARRLSELVEATPGGDGPRPAAAAPDELPARRPARTPARERWPADDDFDRVVPWRPARGDEDDDLDSAVYPPSLGRCARLRASASFCLARCGTGLAAGDGHRRRLGLLADLVRDGGVRRCDERLPGRLAAHEVPDLAASSAPSAPPCPPCRRPRRTRSRPAPSGGRASSSPASPTGRSCRPTRPKLSVRGAVLPRQRDRRTLPPDQRLGMHPASTTCPPRPGSTSRRRASSA
jgi:hypothetical protein